jgi:anthranilate synthase component 1
MIRPTLEEFKAKARKYSLIPVYREILADLETPVSAFCKIDDGDYSFLLESVEGGQLGRYSFLGSNPSIIFRSKGDRLTVTEQGRVKALDIREGDALDELKRILDRYRVAPDPNLPPFHGGAVGFVAYDMIRYFEEIPLRAEDDLDHPDTCFVVTDSILIFDHVNHVIKVVANAHVDADPEAAYGDATRQIDALIAKLSSPLRDLRFGVGRKDPLSVETNRTREEYLKAVRRSKEYIVAGDIFQVIMSVRRQVRIYSSPFDVYRALRVVNPSPYMFYLKMGDVRLAGSSPEILVKLADGKVRYRPLAGTRQRGETEEEDRALADELLRDAKERAEHVMLVDLGRNDIGRVCKFDTVRVDELMTIERYSHVMHIVSNVVGEMDPKHTPYELLRAVFPAGTLSGAPKVRAMQIIDELEPTRRGIYGGAVGYFSFSGNIDFGIILRTIVFRGSMASVQAGAGIVADSDPEREWNECTNKAKGLLRAIEMAENGEI